MAYGNYQSGESYEAEVLRKATSDVALGRAMVFKVEDMSRTDGLSIPPVGAVKKTIRVITI